MTQFNNQNFAVQSQPGQLAPPFETTTVANNVQPGFFIQTLRGWQQNQQNPLDSMSTFQTKSFKG